MKKAFTLIEFIFVIIIIGIIATIALPNLNKNNLPKAAHQVVQHIRYTQHLAMVDDKFDSETALIAGTVKGNWYNKRWRIMFSSPSVNNKQNWSYSIFDDRIDDASGNVDTGEVAVNPLNISKRLSGGAPSSGISTGDIDATDEMNLGIEYGVAGIKFTGCGIGGQTIAFDYLGRPLIGALKNYLTAYGNLLASRCNIDLCTVADCTTANNDEIISIVIEPETGYVHILP